MKLNFLGNGAGFSDTHTGAYFEANNNIYFIDCSVLNLKKMFSLNPENYSKCIVMLTHMHDDHSSGIGLFIQKMYYAYDTKIYLYVPSSLVEDIKIMLRIRGVPSDIYNLIEDNELSLDNFNSILTNHAPDLIGKCFGYSFNLDDTHIVYSGDTNTLEPFKPYLDSKSEFYVDINTKDNIVHLKYDEHEKELLEIANNSDVYLMHMDKEDVIKQKVKNNKLNTVTIKK